MQTQFNCDFKTFDLNRFGPEPYNKFGFHNHQPPPQTFFFAFKVSRQGGHQTGSGMVRGDFNRSLKGVHKTSMFKVDFTPHNSKVKSHLKII